MIKKQKVAMTTLTMLTRKSGQALVEYALVLALIAIVAVLVVKAVGTQTTSTFDNVQSTMNSQGLPAVTPTAASS